MEEDKPVSNNVLDLFLNKRLRVKQNDGTYMLGESISIDGYLNMMLTDVEYVGEGERETYEVMFVRGSYVENISIE